MYKYIKDKKIKIFFDRQAAGVDGDTLLVRHYIHPANTFIRAHVRQLSAEERIAAQAIRDMSELEFVINSRDNIRPDMYVEFRGRTYQIGAPDYLGFSGTEMKFRGVEVSVSDPDQVEYDGWGGGQ